MHIIDNLRIKMLIENNIFELKDFIIDVTSKKTYINNCKIEIKIFAHSRDEFIKRNIHIKATIMIFSHFNVILIIKIIDLSIDRDFLFESFI